MLLMCARLAYRAEKWYGNNGKRFITLQRESTKYYIVIFCNLRLRFKHPKSRQVKNEATSQSPAEKTPMQKPQH